ncbi:MAG TPA: type II toxin-antitoxin system VapC family toxin [Terriglobales bacterium]|nr:type II toxin-antitoxin system VapC family toxin [Terriglobales bacterium]
MSYLLDTVIFLWSIGAKEKLNQRAQELLVDPNQEIYLSAVSSWEISLKIALGKLSLPGPAKQYIPERLQSWGIQPLSITHSHALAVGDLPPHHRDPFDRMLIAQARVEKMVLLTSDHQLSKYDVEIVWCGK